MSFVITLTVSRTENSFKKKETERVFSTHSSIGHRNLKMGILVGLQKEVKITVQIQSCMCIWKRIWKKWCLGKLALQQFSKYLNWKRRYSWLSLEPFPINNIQVADRSRKSKGSGLLTMACCGLVVWKDICTRPDVLETAIPTSFLEY